MRSAIVCAVVGAALLAAIPVAAHPGDSVLFDVDHDTRLDFDDNCPRHFNTDQLDTDADAPPSPVIEQSGTALDRPPNRGGDACDSDDDNDAAEDPLDNCVLVANPEQADDDFDGTGDACEIEDAGDGRDPSDRAPPKVRLSLARRHELDELRAGLTLAVRCSEGCVLEGELLVGARVARTLGMARRAPAVVARGSGWLEGRGRTYVFIRLSARTLRRLERTGPVRAVVRLRAADVNGNRVTLRRRIGLGRR